MFSGDELLDCETLKYLEEYEDAVCFTYGDSIQFEGWVTKVTDEALFVMWRPSPFYSQSNGSDEMSPAETWIKISDINIETLLKNFESKSAESMIQKVWWKFWA